MALNMAQLMLMIMHFEHTFVETGCREQEAPVAWKMDGKAFVIQGKREELVSKYLPKFFPRSKFSSFTRKLYRWEFRQIVLPASETSATRQAAPRSERSFVFAHPFFQRDNPELMAYMESITAAGIRRKTDEDDNNSQGMAHRRTTSDSQGEESFSNEESTQASMSLLPMPCPPHALPQAVTNQPQPSNGAAATFRFSSPANNAYLSLLSSYIHQTQAQQQPQVQQQQQQQESQQLQESALQMLQLGVAASLLSQGTPQLVQLATLTSLLSAQQQQQVTANSNLVALATLVSSLQGSSGADPPNQSGGDATKPKNYQDTNNRDGFA